MFFGAIDGYGMDKKIGSEINILDPQHWKN
jgi:hypothetical protein